MPRSPCAKGKGSKDRVVPIGDTARCYLEDYLAQVRPLLLKEPTEVMFLNRFGKTFGVSGLCKKLKGYAKAAHIDKHITVHSFRHTLATGMLQRGAELRHIQAILGHDCLHTTERYTRVIKTELKKVQARHHPREALDLPEGCGSLSGGKRMTLGEAIAAYQDWRRSQHLADNTMRSTEHALKHLQRFCADNGLTDVRNATTETLLSFALWVRTGTGPRGPWTQNHQAKLVWTAQDLFRYLHETERVLTDITLGLPPMHKGKTLPRNLMNRAQITRLLHQPDLSTPQGFRDRTIFELLYSCGLRGGEVCRPDTV